MLLRAQARRYFPLRKHLVRSIVNVNVEQDAFTAKSPPEPDQPLPVIDKRLLKYAREEVYVVPFDEIPGPPIPLRLPSGFVLGAIQQSVGLGLDWLRTYDLLTEHYGPVIRLGGDLLLISHPQHVAAALRSWPTRPTRALLTAMEEKRQATTPVRMPEYEVDFSKLVEAHGTNLDIKTEQFHKIFDEAADELISRIYELRNLQEEVPLFTNELYKWALNCIFRSSFSHESEEFGGKGSKRTLLTFLSISQWLCWAESGPVGRALARKKLWENIDILTGILCWNLRRKYLEMAALENSGAGQVGKGLVESMVLKERLKAYEILIRLADMVVLGVNVAAHSIGFFLYHLAKHPWCQEKLFAEVTASLDGEKRLKTDNLPYLNACINESIRLRPPFPYLKIRQEHDIILHGYAVPRGTQMILANQVCYRREDLFPSPSEFRPERWLSPHPPLDRPLIFVRPYSHFFHALLAHTAAKLISKFKFEYHYGVMRAGGPALAFPNRPFQFTFMDRTSEGADGLPTSPPPEDKTLFNKH